MSRVRNALQAILLGASLLCSAVVGSAAMPALASPPMHEAAEAKLDVKAEVEPAPGTIPSPIHGPSPPESPKAQTAPTAAPAALASRLPKLPAKLPPGYVMEAKQRIRWIYPESAKDTVADLQHLAPTQFEALSRALGQPIGDELDIRVAVDPADMRKLVDGRPLPDYASGVAFPAQGLILLSLTAPQSWQRPAMEALLVHELAHVALHRAVGNHRVPRWFTEGVAIHFAKERSLTRVRTLWGAALAGQLLPVDQLALTFPAEHHGVDVAYAQSADIVRYMLEGQDDRSRFRRLIRAMRAGASFPDAVREGYHVSLGYLEREWRSQVTRRFGRWPTALAGLTSLWAIGALLLLIGYLRARRRHRKTLARWEVEEAMEEAQAAAQQPAGGGDGPPPLPSEPAAPQRPPRFDEVFDRMQERRKSSSGVPTVRHEGRHYTLH